MTIPVEVLHYDAFSAQPNMGNPAGVVLHADSLIDLQMQRLAKQVGFNETAFVCQSEIADYRFRYFTPGHEMNLCGHATIASVFALYESGQIGGQHTLRIETAAGVLGVRAVKQGANVSIVMEHAAPEFLPYYGDVEQLAMSLGITTAEMDHSIPIVYGSTGTWTLLVPILNLEAFTRMKPINELFPKILVQKPNCSVHPFCLAAHEPNRHVHSRHFSSPYSGTVEDPVTGTASGVIGAYYATFVEPGRDHYQLIMEQGQELGRDGEVMVAVARSDTGSFVSITGTAVFVGRMHV